VIGVYATTFLLALPLALTMRSALRAHLGASLVSESAAGGVNYDWWQEFTSQAAGLSTTFTPSIIGFAATLDSVSSVLDGLREIAPIAAAITLYLGAWTMLIGGIIDRYARQRATHAHGFFAASGVHFFRLLRLALVSALVYWWLFTYVHQWLFLEWFADRARIMSVERDVFFWRVVLYAGFGIVLAAVNVVFDYAKIRLVVEDRRSALGALSAATRFAWRNRGRVAVLYALNAGTFLVLVAIWAAIAPGTSGAGPAMWLTFGLSQAYLIARLVLKLQFLASQTALFQSTLAHAAYTAAPVRTWPESPSAELIARG
jgi:hypothetical protein